MPVRRKMRDVNDILRNEPMVDLENDQEEYPELELNEEVEEIVAKDNQSSTEALTSRITLLEGMWQMERWLNNQLETTLSKVEEERNKLEVQLVTKVEGCKSAEKAPTKKRKWNENKNIKEENKKKVKPCKTCGKGHMGKCLKGKGLCYNCGQEGHFANNCSAPTKHVCFNCGVQGHEVKGCPKKEVKESEKVKQ